MALTWDSALLLFLTLSLWDGLVQEAWSSEDGTGPKSAVPATSLNKHCTRNTNCGACIQASGCAWCAQEQEFKGSRCDFRDKLVECERGMVIEPVNKLTVVNRKPLNKDPAVQITPQYVETKLRVNEPLELEFSYSPAEDYPLDLYYLMDLSNSMKDDKAKLATLGNKLAETMKNLTSKFRIGFGSFVDKIEMPFVSTVPEKLVTPCAKCTAPYGYKNHMRLTDNTSKFSKEVDRAKVSGNLDSPEGGFDAIMQAVVCTKDIGWRESVRRLLVFSTDAGFHLAGDGKLAGIVKPNDGMCHMKNGLYTHSTKQDYPSISQLNQKVKEHSINLIFAVTGSRIHIYDKLKKHIEGSSSGKLEGDSSNVVDLIKLQYDKITSGIQMKDTSPDMISVSYWSSCLGDGPKIQTNECKGLKEGNTVTFTAKIQLTSCPKNDSQRKTSFKITPVGIQESLEVEVEMMCKCPCETEGSDGLIANSEKCSTHGSLMCGVCKCYEDFIGQKCQCNRNSIQGNNELDGCRPDNTTDTLCNNLGSCTCGICDCYPRPNPEEEVYGKHCECDNFSCRREDGQLCSGPNRGECQCGSCECKPGWSGPSCACQISNDTCIPPGGGDFCSGNGDCVCGNCECFTDRTENYTGKYCQDCSTCPTKCPDLEPCVECQVDLKKGELRDKVCDACDPEVKIELVDKMDPPEENEKDCPLFYDKNDCRIVFSYYYNDQDEMKVKVMNKENCPRPPNALAIILSVIGAIVAIGLLLLLLWKLITTIYDKREYAKFEEELKKAKWQSGNNPLYKNATTQFKNPVFSSN